MRKHALAILLILAVTACKKSGSKSEPAPPPPATIDAATPAPPPTTIDAAPVTGTVEQHRTCSPSDACVAGLTCMPYTPLGKQAINTTCEIPCEPKGAASCPSGQVCMVVGDGADHQPVGACLADGSGTPSVPVGGGGGSGSDKGSSGGGHTKPPTPPASTLPKQAEACPDGKCQPGLSCLTYYGIAGTRGPKFTSCEIPCRGGAKCPSGQTCQTIADGPGQVCRP